jgi:hypothetical protein
MKSSEKVNLLIEQIKAQQEQMQAQQEQMQAQQEKIDQLIKLNHEILINTDKMGKHIDFINRTYDKISRSYFFKNILG